VDTVVYRRMKKETISGEKLFEQYYSGLLGERWNSIKAAFLNEPDYCAFGEAESEEKYYIDAASVLCAGCLPVGGAESILDMCAAPGGKCRFVSERAIQRQILPAF